MFILIILAAICLSGAAYIYITTQPKNLNKNVPSAIKSYFNGTCNSYEGTFDSLTNVFENPPYSAPCQTAYDAFQAANIDEKYLVDSIEYDGLTLYAPVDQGESAPTLYASRKFPFTGKLDNYASLLMVDGQTVKIKRFYNSTIDGTWTT